MRTPGYMRLTLTSMAIDGKPRRVRTSSTFLKGIGPRHRLVPAPGDGDGVLVGAMATGKGPTMDNAMIDSEEDLPAARFREAIVGPERRLKFRLIEPLPIHP